MEVIFEASGVKVVVNNRGIDAFTNVGSNHSRLKFGKKIHWYCAIRSIGQ